MNTAHLRCLLLGRNLLYCTVCHSDSAVLQGVTITKVLMVTIGKFQVAATPTSAHS